MPQIMAAQRAPDTNIHSINHGLWLIPLLYHHFSALFMRINRDLWLFSLFSATKRKKAPSYEGLPHFSAELDAY